MENVFVIKTMQKLFKWIKVWRVISIDTFYGHLVTFEYAWTWTYALLHPDLSFVASAIFIQLHLRPVFRSLLQVICDHPLHLGPCSAHCIACLPMCVVHTSSIF